MVQMDFACNGLMSVCLGKGVRLMPGRTEVLTGVGKQATVI